MQIKVMKLKNLMFGLIFLMASMINLESDLNIYQKLEIKNVSSINHNDLPSEFSEKAFKTVDEFIRKTRNLDYEIVLYFDYMTEEILKCIKGCKNKVSFEFENKEFEGHHVASIHNHPKDVYSPPSDKNFGILVRDFEDYELVASKNELWVLKAKGVFLNLHVEFKFISRLLFRAALEDCKLKYDGLDKINEKCDEKYGDQLLNYINNKNLINIQLTKLEYKTMPINSNDNVAQYNCLKKIDDPKILEKIDERNANPNILTGKDAVYALYQLMGIEIEYDEIFAD